MQAMQGALVFLLVGFGLDLASAFTTAFSRRWGKSRGQLASFVLRNILGIPLWVIGVVLAVKVRSKRRTGRRGERVGRADSGRRV